MMRFIFITFILLLVQVSTHAQELSIIKNPYNINGIDCLPIRVSETVVTNLTDSCNGFIYVKGEYKNGLKQKSVAVQGEYFYRFNYQDGELDGQQIVIREDSLELLLLHYNAGAEHGWSVLKRDDITTRSLSFIFSFSINDSVILYFEYLNEGVPLRHIFTYDMFTYEVFFYRSGMPASYIILKGGDCIYAGSYYESGMIWRENEGIIRSKVGQGDSSIGIHSFERSNLNYLEKGKHIEYDRNGTLIAEKLVL